MSGQEVAQPLHALLVGARQIDVRDSVEAYQVDSAFQSLYQSENRLAVLQ